MHGAVEIHLQELRFIAISRALLLLEDKNEDQNVSYVLWHGTSHVLTTCPQLLLLISDFKGSYPNGGQSDFLKSIPRGQDLYLLVEWSSILTPTVKCFKGKTHDVFAVVFFLCCFP